MFFEGEGELFPFGEERGAFCAEGFQFGGVLLGLVGGGEVAEAGFGGGDQGFEAGDLFFGVAEAFTRKRRAADNPWGAGATTLEWTLSSPPPFHQYSELPLIR